MIINYGPKSSGTKYPYFNDFKPLEYIQIKFNGENDFSPLNQNGISGKYSYYQEGKKWCLKIFDSCQLNILKKIQIIDLGMIGGGGYGGNAGAVNNYGTNGGGGGGAGGKKRFLQTSLPLGIYTLTVGNGGREEDQQIIRNGESTSIIKDDNNTLILKALGGEGGGDATVKEGYWNENNKWIVEFNEVGQGGSGSLNPFSASGGYGGFGNGDKAEDGTNGQYLFSSSIFNDTSIDFFQVGGGGGGGSGSCYEGQGHDWAWKKYNPSSDGIGEYGQGGHGEPYPSGASREGKKGLIVLRSSP